VGVIALVGLATQTGVVMIVYIDQAYEKRLREGRIHTLEDIISAHAEGTVQRVRPKLMTVGTMLIGLVPLLWARGSGADVMKRIAAPMVGGLVTSAFLTLEIIPVIYTYWRNEQLLWRKTGEIAPGILASLKAPRVAVLSGACVAAASLVVLPYLPRPPRALGALFAAGCAALVLGLAGYAVARRRARRLVDGRGA
jgi:Cu(I)/Ag(I) efflux system membrane protein CusA/SilA